MFKRVVLSLTIFLSIAMAAETTVTRGQFWGRITYKPVLEKGWGFMVSAGMRDNFSINKEVDGAEKPSTEQNFWLKELMIGPTYSRKLSEKLTMSNNILYRPQLWFPDNRAGENYLRHTLMVQSNLKQNLGKLKLHYRVSLWEQFEATQSTEIPKSYDNELYLRLMAGPEITFGKKVTLSTKIEPFLKLTASETDIDGAELFNKLVSWNGIALHLTNALSLSTEFVHMSSFPKEGLTVRDNYIYAHMVYAPKTVKKKK